MAGGRWDWLYERQSVPLREYILDSFAEQVAKDVKTWPPPIEGWETPAAEKRFKPVLEAPKPSDGAIRLALMLARLDFEHREDEIDGFMRTEAWRAYAKTDADFEAAMFLHRWFFDRALDLKDHADGAHLKYADLADLMGRIERNVFQVTLN